MVGLKAGLGIGLQLSRGTGFEPEAEALFERMASQPDAARKRAINTLIGGLKVAGVWERFDVFTCLRPMMRRRRASTG